MSEKNTDMTQARKPESQSEQPQKTKKGRILDNIAKVLMVLLAFLMWLYVFSTNDATKTVEATFDVVPVSIVGTEEIGKHGLAVLDMSFYNLNITLKGTRGALNNVTGDNLSAYVDLSDISEPGVYVMNVKYSMPSGVALADSVKKEEIEITVDTLSTKSFAVDHTKIMAEKWSLDSSCTIDYERASVNIDYVKFEAPTMLLEKIVDLRLRLNDTVSQSDSVNLSATVEALDETGAVITDRNLRITASRGGVVRSQVSVTLPIVKMKEVKLSLHEENGLLSDSMITLSPSTVYIKGAPSAVDSLASLSLGSFSLKDYPHQNGKVTFEKALSTFPQSVTPVKSDGSAYEENVLTVGVSVTVLSSVTLTVPTSYCKIVGGEATVLDESLQLTLSAVNNATYLYLLQDAIAQGKGGVTLAVNVEDLDLTREVKAPVTVVFTGEYSGKVYEIFPNGEPYTVTVSGGSND